MLAWSFLTVGIILGGPSWYRFFGAGEARTPAAMDALKALGQDKVTAISVSMYGNASSKSVEIGNPAVACAWICTACEAPNSSAASIAPIGVHPPKITAASAMKPRPAVI